MRRTRYLLTFLVLASLGGGAWAGDAEETGKDEQLALARLAMEAKLRIGDLYRQRGELDAAHASYREALAIYERAVRQGARGKVVMVAIDKKKAAAIGGRLIGNQPAAIVDAKGIQSAVDAGLGWLANHQDEMGRWDSDEFSKHDPVDDKCDGPGTALYDVGITGLAVAAFLGSGYSDQGTAEQNRYARTVRIGLKYLLEVQDAEGCFGARASQHYIYNHAMATLAMCEAYRLTRNPRYQKPAKLGVDFIQRARNPYLAWRYGPRGGENDTSVTGWCVRALASAVQAGFEVDPGNFLGAKAWIEKMTDPDFGSIGYNMPGGSAARPEGLQDKFPPERSQSMTASGVLTRLLVSRQDKAEAILQKGIQLIVALPPAWNEDNGSIDMYYWFHGALALREVGGEQWYRWRDRLAAALVSSQHRPGSGARTGSWDPAGPWGPDGGRVYSTALMTMSLQACLPARVQR